MTHHITRNPKREKVYGFGWRWQAKCTCGQKWSRYDSTDLDEDLRKHREATS